MYIPTSTHVPQPSPQAQDLGQRIASVVRAYLNENPGVRSTDVAQAFMVARQLLRSDLGGVGSHAAVLVIVGLITVLFFGIAASLYLGGGFDLRFPMIAIVAGLMVVAAVVVLIAKRGV
jgi:hypothetical protein